jgi:hypothetical protein
MYHHDDRCLRGVEIEVERAKISNIDGGKKHSHPPFASRECCYIHEAEYEVRLSKHR